MKKLLLLLPLLLLMLPRAEASHIVGGDISYKHIEGTTYEILLRVYRDCFYGLPAAQFDDPAAIGVFNEQNMLVDELLIPYVTDDTLTAAFANPCLFVPDDVCVHTTEYRDTITLAPLTSGLSYTFVYQRCCRNQTITNIVNPEETGASYTVRLTAEAMAQNNSSADFGPPAPIFICVGESIDYDHSATETEGDELMYSFCLPKQGASVDFPRPQPPTPPPYPDVVLEEGFELTNLLGGGPDPMTIDPQTGFITGTPQFVGQYVVGVCVQEFRDGVLLSTVRRDFQYNVGQCLEVQSLVAAPAAQCDDLTVDFTNISEEADDFLWFFDYPNNLDATSTEVNPSYTYPDTGTYTIRLIAEPDIDCADTLDFEVFLQFNSLTADFDFQTYECGNRSVITAQDASVDLVSPVVQWEWTVVYGDSTLTSTLEDPTFTVESGATGTITLTATTQNGCVQTTVQPFTTGVDNPLDDIVNAHTICTGEGVELNPDFDPTLGYSYVWTPATGLDDPNSPNPTASPDSDITYTVTATATGVTDCSLAGEVNVSVLPQPILAFDFEVGCNDLTVSFINQSQNAASVVWNFDDNGNTSTQLNPTYTFSDYGTYEISLAVADSELCRDTLTQSITLMPLILEADFTFAYTDCSEEEITVQFTNTSQNTLDNTATFQWTFSNGTTSDEPNPVVVIEQEQELTATLTITTDEGCTSDISRSLNVDFTELNISPTPVQVCLGTSQGLNPGGNPSYQYIWLPEEGLDDPTAANPLASPDETTTYTVIVQNISADTCTITREVTVTVPPAIGLTVSDDIQTCEDAAVISAGTVTDTDLIWTGGGINTTTETVDVAVSGTTVYTVTATDEFGCTETESVTVAGGAVAITAEGDDVICDDEALNVFATNLDSNDDLTYTWSPAEDIVSGGNTANPVVTNEPGIYTFTVEAESQFGCEATETVDAVIYDTDAQFSFDFEIECSGATVNFSNTSTNAFGYAWDFGVEGTDDDTSTEDNPTFTFPAPGIYTVTLGTIYDVDCVTPITMDVEIPQDLLIADFDLSYETCETDEIVVNFTDQTTNFLNNTVSWEWTFSNGETSTEQNPTVVLTPEDEGQLTATLFVTTALNCVATYMESFEIDFIEENTTAEVTICYGDAAELNPGGSDTYTYQWTPADGLSDANAANPIANPLETTVYNVTITNTTNADVCEITRQVTLTVTDQIALESSEDVITCGEVVTLTAMTATPDLTIEWTDSNGDTYSGFSIDVLPETALDYYVTATNFFGCTESDTTNVFNGNMDLTTQGTRIICPVESLVIEAFNNDFSDVVDWQWEAGPGGIIISGANNNDPTVSVQTEGVPVQFYVTATNQYNCSAQDSVTVIMSEFMPAFEAQVPVCEDVPTEINPNANEQYVYEWSPAFGLDDPNVPNPTATLTENQIYTVTITDFQGIDTCFSVETVEVIVNPEIGIAAAGDTLLCAEETVNISASSATDTQFEWATDPDFDNIFATGATVPVTPVGEVTYYVRATDDLGCIEESSVTLSSFPLDYDLADSQNLCFRDETDILVVNNAADQTLTYQWSPLESIISGATTDNPTVNPLESETFYVEITNQIGCTATDSSMVVVENVETDLFATATPDTILFGSGETSQLMTVEDEEYKYDWQPSFSLDDNEVFNPIALPEETTTYTVTVTGPLGCVSERSVEVVVVDLECREPFVFIPNAFTPNGDNENDILYVRGSNIDEVFLTVYNRWGEKMFETNDKNIGWDGTYKGEQLPPDVYGYYMKVICFNGMEYFKKGNITLMR